MWPEHRLFPKRCCLTFPSSPPNRSGSQLNTSTSYLAPSFGPDRMWKLMEISQTSTRCTTGRHRCAPSGTFAAGQLIRLSSSPLFFWARSCHVEWCAHWEVNAHSVVGISEIVDGQGNSETRQALPRSEGDILYSDLWVAVNKEEGMAKVGIQEKERCTC